MSKKRCYSLVSWNVNGIRAAERKGFVPWLETGTYDMVCLQETKVHDHNILSEQLKNPKGYVPFWHGAQEKKGYSGTVIYTKEAPQNVKTDFGNSLLSQEGRVLQLEFDRFILFNIYFPNGGASDERLQYKLQFYKEFLACITELKQHTSKPIIFCGDVNTAHHEIDLARPKQNITTSGFMPIERVWLDQFEQAGFIDTFRTLNTKKTEVYSWWDMKTRARSRNVGWRIDYFFADKKIQKDIKKAAVLMEKEGSDHCPVQLDILL